MVPSRLPFLLSMTAGSVDTAGFLALNGFFAAHVTANFVTLTSSIVQGNTPWIIAKPLVLPVFFMTVIMIRMVSIRLTVRWAGKEIRILLAFQVVCFLAASLLLLVLNTSDGREWLALLPGGMLVVGMAIQNGAQRIYLPHILPTTVMTGTLSQLAIDTVDIIRSIDKSHRQVLKKRAMEGGINILGFTVGCVVAATLFSFFGNWCFMIPPILASLAILHIQPGVR